MEDKVKRSQKQAYEKSIEFLKALTDGQSNEIKRLRKEIEWQDMVISLAQRKQGEAEAERDALLGKWINVDGTLPAPGMRVLATDGVFVGEAYRTSANTWRRYDGMAMRDCLMSSRKTAEEIFLSPGDVDYHLRMIEIKTGLNPRVFVDLVKLLFLCGEGSMFELGALL